MSLTNISVVDYATSGGTVYQISDATGVHAGCYEKWGHGLINYIICSLSSKYLHTYHQNEQDK